MDNNKEIILGLDVSTTTIGCCIFLNDESEYGKIIKLTHVVPKVSNKIKGIESLFLKKQIFNDEFLINWKDFGITRVIIEEPLLSSNNINTVATLLRFNGMISDCVYHTLGIVPEYISSYDARKFSFPELMAVRKFNKKGEMYDEKKITKAIKNSELVLFGDYPWDIDKKLVMWNKVSEIFKDIEWIYDKKGELKKENFDANDALITCLAVRNKELYEGNEPSITKWEKKEDVIHYTIETTQKNINKQISFK
jgi:hypothetical protein